MEPRGRASERTAPVVLPGLLEMVGATLLWGATFVVIRDSVARVDPVGLVFARFAIASPLLLAFAVATRRRFDRMAWVGGGIVGALGAVGFVLQAAGLRHTSAGTSAFLTALGSLFAGVFAWPLLGQRPSAALASGILVAGLGIALLTGVGALTSGAQTTGGLAFASGEWMTLGGAVAFGLQVVALARFAPRADPVALAAVQATALALVVAPFGAARIDAALLEPAMAMRLVYLVIAGSIVAPLLQVLAQRVLSAGRTGLLLGLEPVFAAGFAVSFGGEHPPALWWAGAALILSAVWLVESRAAKA